MTTKSRSHRFSSSIQDVKCQYRHLLQQPKPQQIPLHPRTCSGGLLECMHILAPSTTSATAAAGDENDEDGRVAVTFHASVSKPIHFCEDAHKGKEGETKRKSSRKNEIWDDPHMLATFILGKWLPGHEGELGGVYTLSGTVSVYIRRK